MLMSIAFSTRNSCRHYFMYVFLFSEHWRDIFWFKVKAGFSYLLHKVTGVVDPTKKGDRPALLKIVPSLRFWMFPLSYLGKLAKPWCAYEHNGSSFWANWNQTITVFVRIWWCTKFSHRQLSNDLSHDLTQIFVTRINKTFFNLKKVCSKIVTWWQGRLHCNALCRSEMFQCANINPRRVKRRRI